MRLSKYAPEMVNTEEKRMRRFQQGLTLKIQKSLLTTRVDTYAELVELAQRIEDHESKIRDIQSVRRAGPRTWGSKQSGPSQAAARPPSRSGGFPQKSSGEPSTAPLAKQTATGILCGFCGKGNHSEKDCWRKAGKCLWCGSTEHQIRECPMKQSGAPAAMASGSGPSKKAGTTSKARVPA